MDVTIQSFPINTILLEVLTDNIINKLYFIQEQIFLFNVTLDDVIDEYLSVTHISNFLNLENKLKPEIFLSEFIQNEYKKYKIHNDKQLYINSVVSYLYNYENLIQYKCSNNFIDLHSYIFEVGKKINNNIHYIPFYKFIENIDDDNDEIIHPDIYFAIVFINSFITNFDINNFIEKIDKLYTKCNMFSIVKQFEKM